LAQLDVTGGGQPISPTSWSFVVRDEDNVALLTENGTERHYGVVTLP
jgi:hypothetical protein